MVLNFQVVPFWVILICVGLGIFWIEGNHGAEPTEVVVTTKLGKIKGTKEISRGGKYLAFRGIHYALPPIKNKRFQKPEPVLPWNGILDGTKDGPVCPQHHFPTNQVIGNENCLLLNVYTPDVDNLKPVIMFIHGGGFVTGTGSSELYGPDLLMEPQNVLLVTIQYRLGVFGFLSMGEDWPGNWGLLDQIEALRWINSNIVSFGGDPEKITVLGEGAGAASATLLTFTSQSKGLFHNVIALGGTPFNSQYWQTDPLESARELASRVKCAYDDLNGLLDCLQNLPMEILVTQVNNMFSFFSFPRWFAPSVDSVLLTSHPEKLLADGNLIKVPILTGLARHEGAFYYPLTLNSFNDGKYDGNFIDQKLPKLLPILSEFETKLFPLTKALKTRYFTNIEYDNEDEFRPRYIDFLTDLLFTRFTVSYGNVLGNETIPAYVFVFDYFGSNSIMNVIGDTDMKSITHGDILQYLFNGILGDGKELPDDDRAFATNTFLPLLINFVKSGNPTPIPFGQNGLIWPQFNIKGEEKVLLSLGSNLSLLKNFRSNILKFWEETIPKVLGRRHHGGDDSRDEL